MSDESESDDPLVPELAADLGWRGLVLGDYAHAVIRLATTIEARVNYLVWAGVELLPCEIRPPSDAKEWLNCGKTRLVVSRTTMSLSDALAWYERAWQGAASVPRTPSSVLTGTLGPEPSGRWFVLRDDSPFSPGWHLIPRTHRLVPMDEPPTVIAGMAQGMAEAPRFQRARQWLEAKLHFDVLAHDDWLGGIALVAPNPIQRANRVQIIAEGSRHETVELRGQPRMGVNIQGVEAVFQERRAGGAGWRASVPLDKFGAARVTMPRDIAILGHQIVCPLRGLLHEDLPAPFFRSLSIRVGEPVRERVSQPARRRRSDPAPPPLRTFVRQSPAEQAATRPADPLRRLGLLQQRRENRFGHYRALRVETAPEDVIIFGDDRAEAVLFIQRQIARAQHRVLFIDPYFEPADLQEFAYATEQQGVAIGALFALRASFLRDRLETAPQDVSSNGAWLERELDRMSSPELGFGPIDIRVMRYRKFHDRFLQIDNALWHCGHSFSSVGLGEMSVMSRVARPQQLIALIEAVFAEAESFQAFWSRERAMRPRRDLAARIGGVLRHAAACIEGASRTNQDRR